MLLNKILKLLALSLICIYYPGPLLALLERTEDCFVFLQVLTLIYLANSQLVQAVSALPEMLNSSSGFNLTDTFNDIISIFAMSLFMTVAINVPLKLLTSWLLFVTFNFVCNANNLQFRLFSLMDIATVPAIEFVKDFLPVVTLFKMPGPQNRDLSCQ